MGERTVKSGAGLGTCVGIVLLLASGLGYRTLAARFSRPSDSVPLAPGTLSKLPLKLGNWVGQERPLDDVVIQATDTDDHINREYWRQDGRAAVSLFVAYGVHLRDLEPHRPEVCYTGAGWILEASRKARLTVTDGGELPCQLQNFRRGGLAGARITVLSYYIIDGEYCPDVSLLRSMAWRTSHRDTYAVQVQVACGGSSSVSTVAEQAVESFAAESAPVIRDLLVAAVKSMSSPTSGDYDEPAS